MDSRAFVARARELGRLDHYLARALAGQGQVAFVVGEAGSGKTALVTEFASRAQEAHGDLVMAIGDCNAQTSIGDPYLPFREILAQLTGDVEAQLAEGAITSENARRLRGLVRRSCGALMDVGPDLINALVPGTLLVAKAGAFVLDQVGWLDKLKQLVESKAAVAASSALDQSHIFEQCTNVLRALAQKNPLLVAKAGAFVLDQVGWLDKLKQLVESKAAVAAGSALDQSHIFEQCTNVLRALAQKNPLLLVLDDLQWADSASTSLLFHLGRRIADSRILVLGAYRPEEVQLGRGGERHPLEKVLSEFKRYFGDAWVDLDQAEKAEARQFVDALLDLEPNRLGPSFRRVLVQHTGGHPLFAVELLQDMQAQGALKKDTDGCWEEASTLDWDALPPRVEGVIEERIDRLEAELQETLTVGSVEGEEFTAEVIARVRAVDERGLVRRLSNELDRQHHLVMSQGVRRLGGQALSSYGFRHDLFQKYLYNRLDAAQKAYLHEDVGNALEALYGDQAAEIAVHLGRHFEQAGLAEKAIHYLRLAAEQAMRVSANTEAIGHLSRALTLLQTLPASEARDQSELPLQMSLCTATAIAQGWAAPGVRAALERARQLCRGAENAPQLIPILRGLCEHYCTIAEHHVAYELAAQLLALAKEAQDRPLLVMAHQALGQIQTAVGDFVAARRTLERGLAYHDPEAYRSLAYLYGKEHGISAHLDLALLLFALGYPDQSLAHLREALTLAEALAHPLVLASTLHAVSSMHLWRGESQAALEFAEKALALCREKGIPVWQTAASINRGYALALQGRTSEGIAEASQGLSAYRSMGTNVMQTLFLTQLAETALYSGQIDAGLTAVNEGLVAGRDTDERGMEAELYRLRAELLRRQGHEAQAEADLQRAIDVARAQQARMWELRSTVSLCRLWRDQGRQDEARPLLGDICGWFTEGLDTPILQEAKALLEELAGPEVSPERKAG